MRRQTFRESFITFLVVATVADSAVGQGGAAGSASRVAPAAGGENAPVAPVAPPLADVLTGQAKLEYEAGKLLYQDGDFAGATLKFQRAYEISREGRLLWNVAVCEKNLRHYANVLRLVRRYQLEAGATLSDSDKQEAADLVNAVSSFVSPVWLTVSETGASISVDDVMAGTSPTTEPLLVDMGARRIKVSKPGFRDHFQDVHVAGMTELRLSIKLERESLEGRLLIAAGPGETIFLDGKVVGEGRWDGKVPPGRHAIRVTAPDKQPYESEVEVRSKETRELRISLPLRPKEKEPEASSTWLWITGGSVLLAGAMVGGYFLLKPEDQAAPSAIPGTMAPGTVQMPLTGAWR